jgi:predicted dehydrogenase
MSQLRFGIVGTGMIAGALAVAIGKSPKGRLTAVSSRRIDKAASFVAQRPGVLAVQGVHNLVAREDVDAVYIATPTTAKEKIALAAAAAGKHILVDKPFVDEASVLRISRAAAERGLAFMDATHFVHHPRTAAIQTAIPERIGMPQSLHTTFCFPLSDHNNIRFDVGQEPMSVIGDMAWYSMRAIVEYLRPRGPVSAALTIAQKDPQTRAVLRASGVIAFEDRKVSTFDVGYTTGAVAMDLQLLGPTGMIQMDDFVLDWKDSFVFKNKDIETGYFHRTGMATRKDTTFVPTPASAAQEVLMINEFVELATSGNAAQRSAYVGASLMTQRYLDRIWAAASA